MAADFLLTLFAANLAASVAILVVFLLRGPIRRLAGARLAYWLWLTPVAASIAVMLPALPAGVAPAAPIRPMMEDALDTATSWIAQPASAQLANAPAPAAIDSSLILLALWILGACACLALMLWRQRRGMAAFGTVSPGSDGLWRATGDAGPAVIGLFRPRLVTPADFEGRFTVRERDLVLAHERAHLAAGRTRINAGLALLSCINWFNPLAHLGARCARSDQELSCDAAVVARFPGERRIYAEALLKTQLAPASLPLGCTWPSRSSSLLKERVMMLARKSPRRSARIAGAVLVSAIAIGSAVVSWAQTPALPLANGSPMVAPGNPRTMTEEHAWKTLQRLREPDGGPPGVAPDDLKMLRAQLEARFSKGSSIPIAPALASLDREAVLKAVQADTPSQRIANVTYTCDVWTDKYSNVGASAFDWNTFNEKAAVVLSIDGDSQPTVTLPDNAFPASVFPAHGNIVANNRYIDTSSISYRLMSSTLIDSLTFIELDRQIAKVKWERIKLGANGPRETFLTGYCRR